MTISYVSLKKKSSFSWPLIAHSTIYELWSCVKHFTVCVRMRTCWALRELETELWIFWQVEGDLGCSRWVVYQSERYHLPKTSIDPVKLEMGLKNGREKLKNADKKNTSKHGPLDVLNQLPLVYQKKWNQWMPSQLPCPDILLCNYMPLQESKQHKYQTQTGEFGTFHCNWTESNWLKIAWNVSTFCNLFMRERTYQQTLLLQN